MLAKHNVFQWCEENRDSFEAPVCNKLMYKHQLCIMFVRGPNIRTDFHLDEGSEFFYMLHGNQSLLTIQAGKLKVVEIKEGQVYIVPSRIPHSPQRPESGSLGLVIERKRDECEVDGLRWYTDGRCYEILWEKYFHCDDLGKDLVPVVEEFLRLDRLTKIPGNLAERQPIKQDISTIVPDPFLLSDWIVGNSAALAEGQSLNLFADHPDKEFRILIVGGPSSYQDCYQYETWLYQIIGSVEVIINGNKEILEEGECGIIPSGTGYMLYRPTDSIGMVVMQDPNGNKLVSN